MKILYIHPAIRIYRQGIFELLAQRLGVDFFWSASPKRNESGKSHSYNEIHSILNTTDIHYTQAKDWHRFPIDNFSLDLFKIPFQGYDVVIFSNITSTPCLLLSPLLKLIGVKTLVFDELWRYPIEVRKYRYLYKYVKFIARHCLHGVIAAGSKAKTFYEQEFGLTPDNIVIAHNTTVDQLPLTTSETKRAEIENRINMVSKKKRLLYLGRLVRYKGLDVLINAMPKVNNDYDLIVVGDGNPEYVAECQSLVRELSLENRVKFLGACTSEESAYFYQACEIFVLPTRFYLESNVQMESWGFTLNEAMSLERPVIATDAVGSAYDLIKDGETGFQTVAGDHDELSEKINTLININTDQIIGKNARRHLLATCDYDKNYAAYQAIINKVSHHG